MMRNALALVLLGLMCVSARNVSAQEITFRGSDVMQLAKIIHAEARKTGLLPSAYLVPMSNNRTMVITAANAFEILSRAIAAWQATKDFPATVAMHLLDLSGPAYDPTYEPKSTSTNIAVPSVDIGTYAPVWIGMIEAPGHKLLKGMTFESNYRLSAAQIILAMATLIDETQQRKEMPSAVAIRVIASPHDWSDTSTPLPTKADLPDEPDLTRTNKTLMPDTRITLNGIEMTERGPRAPGITTLPPFCGMIAMEVTGFGTLTGMRVMLDSTLLHILEGLGPHQFTLNSAALNDGGHTLAITSTDTQGRNYVFIFSFTVMNGRQSGFTPAEQDDT